MDSENKTKKLYWQLGRAVGMIARTADTKISLNSFEVMLSAGENIEEMMLTLIHSILETGKYDLAQIIHFLKMSRSQVFLIDRITKGSNESEDNYLKRIMNCPRSVRIRRNYLSARMKKEKGNKEIERQFKFLYAFC
jgi:hypothetical protein